MPNGDIMKRSPQTQKLEDFLHSSKLVAGGFLGTDTRPLAEIIDADLSTLEQLGYTTGQIADRLAEISDKAKEGLGTRVKISDALEAVTQENRGVLVCPWPHEGHTHKTVTTLYHLPSGDSIQWADMCIHLIREHGFFQGHGSVFRIDPEKLVKIIFS